jgi:hypothetical protein
LDAWCFIPRRHDVTIQTAAKQMGNTLDFTKWTLHGAAIAEATTQRYITYTSNKKYNES